MPLYEYENEAGERIEQFHRMGEAPSEVTENGAVYRRVYSAQISAGVAAVTHQYPYVSRSLPRKLAGEPKDPKTGHVLVKSRQHEREICARWGYVRD